MGLSEHQIEKLLNSKLHFRFKQLAFAMLVTRLATRYKKEPTTANLIKCTAELNSFIEKFEEVLQSDLFLISKNFNQGGR